ncbi:MAG: hypothetical protein V1701_00705 [Planctomycetota bacterium]
MVDTTLRKRAWFPVLIHNLILLSFVLCIIPSLSLGRSQPPGKYDCSGRVVQKANGEFAIFFGRGCYTFPRKLQGQLQPYVGKFVKVEYTQINGDDEEKIPFMVGRGVTIGRIDKISVLSDTPAALPVMVVAKPAKKEFGHDEPILVFVSITNQSDSKQNIHLGSSYTVLCQDYCEKLVLESEDHYYDECPYGLPKASVIRTLEPGQKLEFTVTSQWMANPGTYQLLYSPSVGPRVLGSQSDIAEVIVRQPKNEREWKKSLKMWLSIATVGQRIDIAEQLLNLGDSSGIKEVLRLLAAEEYSKPHYCKDSAFRFAWQYGGKEGEIRMLTLIKYPKSQDCVLRMIESVYLSPNRIELLQDLLTCVNSTQVDEPRVCDITAAWLIGYTDGKMEFPKNGTEIEKDSTIASVVKILKNNPTFFRVLSESYK